MAFPEAMCAGKDNVARVAAISLLLFLTLSGCDSAEEYRKSPPVEPVEGSVKVSGTPEQLQIMQGLAMAMEQARARCATGDTAAALRRVDSLVSIVESTLDTIPLGQSFAEFLTIYVADGYGTLQEWHTARHDSASLHALTVRYQTLARDLQARRDTAQAAP